MNHIVYNTNINLVEIEHTKTFGEGVITTTWNWEISIAVHEMTYKGKAVSCKYNAIINWIELKGPSPIEEMIGYCKNYMQKNN